MESIISQIGRYFKLGKLERLRAFLNRFFYTILVALLVVLSFLLGKTSRILETQPSFRFESQTAEDSDFSKQRDLLFGKVSTSTIVASKGGKKYYFVWCKGSQNIKDGNKRYFDTEEQAQKAGYSLAANCK